MWNQGPRDGFYLHWDGNNDSLFERNISASLTAGVTEESVNFPNLERVARWLQELPPPAYPFDVDGEAVAEVGPGSILGERSVVEHGLRTSTLTARTAVKVAIADADDIRPEALHELTSHHRREDDTSV